MSETVAHTINYLPGQIGHFSVIVAFVSALLASISYAFSFKAPKEQFDAWLKLSRISFYVHALAVFSIVATVFWILGKQLYEYDYAWQHASSNLPFYYILSCFWEGQEGSFILWSFWHVVLGLVIIRKAGEWESGVMAIVSFTQVFLATMILGIYIFEYKIGISPFSLLRDIMPNIPVFAMNPDFVPQDGTGLNPLLQNYWMVIHPPMLFLGFAATTIPFAYSIVALLNGKYQAWIKPTLVWSLFAAAVLGTGVMMGGAWAYEALSFGGFWAWDPVENASLVPWLTLVAGIHTLLAYKYSGQAIRTTFMLFIATFFLILYSTFLTRSGILGDSSVHSFTDLGMTGQLLIYMGILIVPAIILLIKKWSSLPKETKEENISAREFWLFIGAIVFTISVFQIIISTSLPVINKVFNTNMAPPVDVEMYYNKWQLPIAIIIALLAGVGQYFAYKKSNIKRLIKLLIMPIIASVVLTSLFAFFLTIKTPHYIALLLAAWFALFANLHYFVKVLSAKIRIAGGSITHIGFGLMLVGILISSAKQEVISFNKNGISYGEGFDVKATRENIFLEKNAPMMMGDYRLTYLSRRIEGSATFFKVKYEKLNGETGGVLEEFILEPNVLVDKRMGDVSNPDTKHYLLKDIYTHVTAVKKIEEKESEWKLKKIDIGDTIPLKQAFMVLESLSTKPLNPKYKKQENDIAVSAHLFVHTLDSSYFIEPVFIIRGDSVKNIDETVSAVNLDVRFFRVHPQENKIELAFKQIDEEEDYIIMQAIVFPFINFLWLGIIIMISGIVISIIRRAQQK